MKSKLPAQRLQSLSLNYFSSLTDQINQLESAGQSVIRMDIGSPDLPPPAAVVSQLQISVSNPTVHGYQSHRGLLSLREAWAAHYQNHHNVLLDAEEEILPLLGSKEGIFHLSLALIDPGDQVLIPDPGYQTYSMGTRFSGGIPRYVSCASGEDFLSSLLQIPTSELKRAKLLWANFPHNPTGATINQNQAIRLLKVCRENEIILCHDAAYTQVTYQGYRAPSLLEAAEEQDPVVEFNSLSKSHNMAGWRLGVLVGNPSILEKLYTFKTHADSGHFYPVMRAGTTALQANSDWLTARNNQYQKRRDLAVSVLQSLDLDIETPRGAIYLWVPVPAGWKSMEFANKLLERYLVALTPGTVFGSLGEGYLRLSLTSPDDQLREGLDRIRKGYADALPR